MTEPLPFPPGVRGYRPGDETAILAISLDCLERGDFAGAGVTRHDLEETVSRLPIDPAMCAVAEEDGRIVGWITPRFDELTVAPAARRRGHGTRLVEAGREIARREGRPYLRLWCPAGREGPEAFARRNGLAYHSSTWLMRLPSAVPVEPPAFPDTVTVRAFRPGEDEESYVAMANAAFLDHPSPLTFDVERIRRVHALPGFDPATILLVSPADDPSALVGFCRVAPYLDDDGRQTGDLGPVGLVRDWRGRGVGTQLLRWGVTELRARGADDVFLAVEGENDGALRLYESMGFVRHVEWPHWTIAVAGGPR